MSRTTSDVFADVIEWASEQSWSSGKIGLLGISYFAGSQWRVAARRPKGLAAMVPVDGMADYYRDRLRHGGILTGFVKWWFDRQVLTNQYGLAGKAARNFGPDTIEGDLPEEELRQNRHDQTEESAQYLFRDDEYYASRDYNLQDISTPLLSMANWGSIMIHLHGNYEGYRLAGSEKKFLRFTVGRHDLPFYSDEHTDVIKSFLDAFLKGQDHGGWTNGKRAPIDLILRKGNVGFDNPEAESVFQRRDEHEWPLARTKYTKFYLTPDHKLTLDVPTVRHDRLSYPALGNIQEPHFLCFSSEPLKAETEITGYIVAHLNVSVTPLPGRTVPTDVDLFLTLRHFARDGTEVHYTGITGEPVPLCKGWQRVSLRKVNKEHPLHREWLPHRDYFASDMQPVIVGEIYPVDVEVWATNVIAEVGDRLVFEVASGDTQGSGNFGHDTAER
jgi:predicted acyl esterase